MLVPNLLIKKSVGVSLFTLSFAAVVVSLQAVVLESYQVVSQHTGCCRLFWI